MQISAPISKVTIWWRKIATRLLALSWILGMILGSLGAIYGESTLVVLVRQGVCSELSFTGISVVTMLPFLLSAFAVTFSEPWLLLLISTLKAFSFSFCAWGVCLTFGQSGWLVLILFLFSDIALIPLLYFYWLRHIKGTIPPSFWELPLFLAIALLIGSIDYRFVSPFLSTLMH